MEKSLPGGDGAGTVAREERPMTSTSLRRGKKGRLNRKSIIKENEEGFRISIRAEGKRFETRKSGNCVKQDR